MSSSNGDWSSNMMGGQANDASKSGVGTDKVAD